MNINEKLTHEEQLRVAIDRITDERDELLRQRDRLLDALRMYIGLDDDRNKEGICESDWMQCREVADAAIAECEKGETGGLHL